MQKKAIKQRKDSLKKLNTPTLHPTKKLYTQPRSYEPKLDEQSKEPKAHHGKIIFQKIKSRTPMKKKWGYN